MNAFVLIGWMALTQMSAIEVATLAGEQYQGALEAFSSDSIVVKTDTKSVTIPLAEVLLIRTALQPKPMANDASIEIRLVDQTRLHVQSLKSSGTMVVVAHPRLGELHIPATSISSIRFAPSDMKVDSEWNQLLDRMIKKDVVAVRKGDVLDHLDGVIGSLSDLTMQFQMDGEDIAVKREKIFGLIYSKRESLAKKAIAQLDLVSGDRLALKQIAWNGTTWKVRLVTGLELEIQPELFQVLDYSLGKLTYLSDLEPRTVKHTPLHDPKMSFYISEYRRDKNFDGTRISLGEKNYPKGLAIHSQTLLKYRLGGEYRRFQTVMGIGDDYPIGDVNFVLKGDNKILFKGSVNANEPGDKSTTHRATPQSLDIDVKGVVELEILVDFGNSKAHIGEILYLANARVVK